MHEVYTKYIWGVVIMKEYRCYYCSGGYSDIYCKKIVNDDIEPKMECTYNECHGGGAEWEMIM